MLNAYININFSETLDEARQPHTNGLRQRSIVVTNTNLSEWIRARETVYAVERGVFDSQQRKSSADTEPRSSVYNQSNRQISN